MSMVYFDSQLPWSSSERENRRFTQITYGVLGVTLLLAVGVSVVQLPQTLVQEESRKPPQLAHILVAQEPPPPPIVEPEPEPEPIPEEKPPEPTPEEKPPAPEEVVTPEPEPILEPEPEPEPTPEETVAQARENARQTGVLAFQDQLASLRSDASLTNLADVQTVEGAGQAEQTQRQRIGQEVATSTSGGLSQSDISTEIGARGELAGRRTTEFDAPEQGAASLAAKRIQTESQVIGDRDIEAIRKTLDANKGAVYALYRRALRENPDLEGKLTVNLTIEPNGSLSLVTLVSSELDFEALEQKLLARIRMINFGEAKVKQTKLEYAFNFLPF